MDKHVFDMPGRELPKALTESFDYKQLNKMQAENFSSRLRYIEETARKVGEWVDKNDPDGELLRSFIDTIELDAGVNLSATSPPDESVSFWLVHSVWTSESSLNEMRSALGRSLIAAIDQPAPSVASSFMEFIASMKHWSITLEALLKVFYSAQTYSAAVGAFVAIDIALANIMVTVGKARLNVSLWSTE